MGLRWRRLIVEAYKQSRRCYFPSVGEAKSIAKLVDINSRRRLIIVGDAKGESIFSIKPYLTNEVQEVLMLVGPEGGFSEREIKPLNQKNVLKLSLSNQILRTETAAISLISAVNQII